MPYTPPEYPDTIPGTDDLPDRVDDLDWLYAARYNELKKELRAVMIELGVLPKGDAINVGARIAAGLPHFNDRGDPATVDFDLGDLTEDGAWHDLDLSGIVPANTKAVVLRIRYTSSGVGEAISLRKNGNTNSLNVGEISTTVANVGAYGDKTVAVDGDRKIEYKLSSPATTAVLIVVKGWWK